MTLDKATSVTLFEHHSSPLREEVITFPPFFLQVRKSKIRDMTCPVCLGQCVTEPAPALHPLLEHGGLGSSALEAVADATGVD